MFLYGFYALLNTGFQCFEFRVLRILCHHFPIFLFSVYTLKVSSKYDFKTVKLVPKQCSFKHLTKPHIDGKATRKLML